MTNARINWDAMIEAQREEDAIMEACAAAYNPRMGTRREWAEYLRAKLEVEGDTDRRAAGYLVAGRGK